MSADGPPLPADADNVWEVYAAKPDGTHGVQVTTGRGNAYQANLEAGDYIVVARMGEASVEQRVAVERDKVAQPHFVLNAGNLVIRPLPRTGAEVSTAASVVVDYPGPGEVSRRGLSSLVVPAGEQEITVTIGGTSVTQTLYLEAGKTIQRDIVVGVP